MGAHVVTLFRNEGSHGRDELALLIVHERAETLHEPSVPLSGVICVVISGGWREAWAVAREFGLLFGLVPFALVAFTHPTVCGAFFAALYWQ
jgi:hypothetical protein